jgi:lipid-binding SYLF domain-containing protein
MKNLLMTALLAGGAVFASDANKPEAVARIDEAKTVFTEIMGADDKGIPQDLLAKANCIAIIPGVKKAAFLVGGNFGKGVLMCRAKNGGWSNPATLRLEGGSFGFQAGASETDMVLLVMNQAGADRLMKSEFKLGGEAAVAAGPVGRQANAATDATMRAEMLGYSRARGVFAGVSLEGSTLREDRDDNKAIYGYPYSTEELVRGGKGSNPSEGRQLAASLSKYSTFEKK